MSPVKFNVDLSQDKLNKAINGLENTPATLLNAAYEVNKKWATSVREGMARKLLAFLKKESEDVAVEESKYFYRNTAGQLRGMTAGEIFDALNKPMDQMNEEQIEEYANFYWWTQGIQQKINQSGYRFKVTPPPIRRVQYDIPVHAIPKSELDRMFPHKKDLLGVEHTPNKHLSIIKYLPRGNFRSFPGMMMGNWLIPPEFKGLGGNTKNPYELNHDYGPENPGYLSQLNDNAGFAVMIRPNDPIFINNVLIKLVHEYVPTKLLVLQKHHRQETTRQLKKMLKQRGYEVK